MKGQVSVEQLILTVVIMMMIVPAGYVFYKYSERSSRQIGESQLDRLGHEIVTAAERTYYMGEPSRVTLQGTMPDHVTSVRTYSEWDNSINEIIFTVEVEGRESEFVYPSPVNLKGLFMKTDASPGTKKVYIEAFRAADGTLFSAVNFGSRCPPSTAYDLDGDCVVEASVSNPDDLNEITACYGKAKTNVTWDPDWETCFYADFDGNCLIDLNDGFILESHDGESIADCIPPGSVPQGGYCDFDYDCVSGLFCSEEDNVCCDAECDGPCISCDWASFTGTCTNLPPGHTTSECNVYNCPTLLSGWDGNDCAAYTNTNPAKNGACKAGGLCNDIDDVCSGTDVVAKCGSAECKRPGTDICRQGDPKYFVDDISDVCYVNSDPSEGTCPGGQTCDSTGTCSSPPCIGQPDTAWGAGPLGCDAADQRCYDEDCVTCGGWMSQVAGTWYCWYQGASAGMSCTETCAAHDGPTPGTCSWNTLGTFCSVTRHFWPSCSCSTTGTLLVYRTPSNQCYQNSGSTTNCGWSNPDYWRQCACNS
ncbi:hypothetical protein JXB11_01365 [Candidatus Woesearchaeota archaeon]|nr:hypothetical protein [Candidatus Woesearchaeota archaeon]